MEQHVPRLPLGDLYVFRLPAFRPLYNIKLDRLTLFQGAESVALNGGVMNEHVVAIGAADESEALGIVKPFHCSLLHNHSFCCPKYRRIQCGIVCE